MADANPDKLKLLKRVQHSGILLSMARVPGSSRVYFGNSDHKVYEADLAAEKIEPAVLGEKKAQPADAKTSDEPTNAKASPVEATILTGHSSYVMGVAVAGKAIVSGSYDRRLIWWDSETREPIRVIENAHKKWIRDVAATPDGKIVASIADDMVCHLWDADTGNRLHELRGHKEMTPNHYQSMLHACEISPDGRYLATGDKVGHAVVWDIQTGKQLAAVESPENYTWDPKQRRHSIGGIRSLAFSPDSKQLAVGGIGTIGNIDGLGGKALIQIYDWNKGERTHEFAHDKHKGIVEHLQFHHEGKWLLGAGGAGGGFLLFIDLNQKKFIRDEDAKMHVHAFALNDASDTIYAVGHGNMAVWELKG